MNILVTGANGQLGRCLRERVNQSPLTHLWEFKSKDQLDLISTKNIDEELDSTNYQIIINCAAFTDVPKNETSVADSYLINTRAVRHLARCCKERGIYLIHISTDFVFDGTKCTPYRESDETNPLNQYGISKLMGENAILDECEDNYLIIRTSWLYSEYSQNFFTKMQSKYVTAVVIDEIGSPTNAHDLADAIFKIIETKKYEDNFGIYHYCNSGLCSRYDFAYAIRSLLGLSPVKWKLTPTPLEGSTQVNRPKYSVLNNVQFQLDFRMEIRHWYDALRSLVNKIR